MAQELQQLMAQFKIDDGDEAASKQPKPAAVGGNGNGNGKAAGKKKQPRVLPTVVGAGAKD
jgi:hypothetical protein